MKFDEVLFESRITHENGHTICGLAWNPKGNKEIAFTDNQVSKIVIMFELCYFMQGFQNVLKQVSDWAKVCDCEKFIKGQNVIILMRVTGNMLSSSQQNCGDHGPVSKSMF